MTTVDVASLGLDGPPVVQISQAQLRPGTASIAPVVRISQMELGGGAAPLPPGGRVQIASALLYPGSVGPAPGESHLLRWDGSRWVPRIVVTWNGAAWEGGA